MRKRRRGRKRETEEKVELGTSGTGSFIHLGWGTVREKLTILHYLIRVP